MKKTYEFPDYLKIERIIENITGLKVYMVEVMKFNAPYGGLFEDVDYRALPDSGGLNAYIRIGSQS